MNSQTLTMFVPLILLIVAMYFLLIRPQKKREKEVNNMRANLHVGDEIVTIGGICGKIVAHNYNLAFIFYIINTVMVTVDILLWIRNYRYEKTGKKTFFI